MKIVLIIALLLSASNSYSKELDVPFLEPDSVVVNTNLDTISYMYFSFPNASDMESYTISYSLDGVAGSYLVESGEKLRLYASEGWHNLQFYYNSGYHEEYTSVKIENGNNYHYSVYFQPSEVMIMTEKPVIYLYPKETKEVTVTVAPKGEFTFTYPQYNDGWKVTASPDGTLTADGASYNYLFWEASEKLDLNTVNLNVGFVIPGNTVTAFLEEKLTEAGLNSQERADFITFWAPRMITHDSVFLQFQFNEACDQFGKLDVTPKPHSLYRIYMIWQPVEALRIAPQAQSIKKVDRSGFTVIEWGGQELPTMKATNSL